MEFKLGGIYRTRDNRKVVMIGRPNSDTINFAVADSLAQEIFPTWETGRDHDEVDREHANDIVAEWVDEETVWLHVFDDCGFIEVDIYTDGDSARAYRNESTYGIIPFKYFPKDKS